MLVLKARAIVDARKTINAAKKGKNFKEGAKRNSIDNAGLWRSRQELIARVDCRQFAATLREIGKQDFEDEQQSGPMPK